MRRAHADSTRARARALCRLKGGAGLPAYAPTPSYDTRAGDDALTGPTHALSLSPSPLSFSYALAASRSGRAAMVGLTCMFVQEAITGTPVF